LGETAAASEARAKSEELLRVAAQAEQEKKAARWKQLRQETDAKEKARLEAEKREALLAREREAEREKLEAESVKESAAASEKLNAMLGFKDKDLAGLHVGTVDPIPVGL
jgi:hypothetical protein